MQDEIFTLFRLRNDLKTWRSMLKFVVLNNQIKFRSKLSHSEKVRPFSLGRSLDIEGLVPIQTFGGDVFPVMGALVWIADENISFKIRNTFLEDIELFPVSSTDHRLSGYNVLNVNNMVDILDIDASDLDFNGDVVGCIRKIVTRPVDLRSLPPIFRIRHDTIGIYVSVEGRDLLVRAGFPKAVFSSDLISVVLE